MDSKFIRLISHKQKNFLTLVEPNPTMSNSFYYFFSAVPQVLAGILALFGVFIIFKIQTLNTNIIGIGRSLYERLNRLSARDYSTLNLPEGVTFIQLKRRVDNAIIRKDVNQLKEVIDLIGNNRYGFYGRNIRKLDKFLETLISRTILWSKFTAIVIIVSITAIPFGDLILKNCYILYSLFSLVIIGIVIIFYNLILILQESLKGPEIE